ncbi:Hypothetical protein A7982_02689 [Minicystis rosea]|nr:Hypothetical protein A7982_02689 [Minicystis rosea]
MEAHAACSRSPRSARNDARSLRTIALHARSAMSRPRR